MKKTIAAIAAAAIVLSGFSVALIVQSPNTAAAQEVTSEDTEATAPQTIEDVLAGLVEDGVINEDQATQIATALNERRGSFEGRHGRSDRGARLETVAETIGIDETALREALSGGQSIAEVAEANGSTADAVIEALVAETNAKLDQAVADEKLTAEEADEIRANAQDRIEAMVNGEFEGRHAFGHRGHRGMGSGSGTDLDDTSTDSVDTSA